MQLTTLGNPSDLAANLSDSALTFEERFGIEPWEPRKMTVCIAACCDAGRSLILAADREVGDGSVSYERSDGKQFALYPDWYTGFAGTVANAATIVSLLKRRALPESLASFDVMDAVKKAYRDVRLGMAESQILSSRGWTLEMFLQAGKLAEVNRVYERIDAEIRAYDHKVDLLVAGFGAGEDGPTIFTCKNPGLVVEQSALGFWCIGSGASVAQSSFFQNRYDWKMPTAQAAYLVYEAKTLAEQSAGVGPTTDIYLIKRGITPIRLQPGTIDVLREIKAELAPKIFGVDHHRRLEAINEFRVHAM